MNKEMSEILAIAWGGFAAVSGVVFLICSAEYVANGKIEYLQRLAVVEGIALLVLLGATAAVLGVARYKGEKK